MEPADLGTQSQGRTLGDRVRLGILWNALALGGEKGVHLLVQLILARLLLPEDFGLIGMAVVFTGLIQVASELGIGAAVIQRRERELAPDHLDVSFWVGVGSSAGAILLCIAVVGPVAVWFYDEPILWRLITVISLAIPSRALTGVHRAVLSRELRFGELGLGTLASVLVGGAAAVGMAFAGFGVWSIAWQGVISAAVGIPMFWILVCWRPRFSFSRKAFTEVFGFGMFVTAYDSLKFVGQNIDYLLIGKFVGASALGAYALAYLITRAFQRLVTGIMTRVMFPVYGKLQDTPERARRYYLNAVRLNTLLAFPVLAFLILFPEELVTLLFGPRWEEAAFPLRMLSLATAIYTVGGTSASVMRGLGHVRLQFGIYLAFGIILASVILGIGVWLGGMKGVAVGMVVTKLVGRMVGQYYMRRFINVTEYDVVRAVMPAAVSAALMVGVAWIIRATAGSPTTLAALGLVAVLAALPSLVFTYFRLRQELGAVRSLLRGR